MGRPNHNSSEILNQKAREAVRIVDQQAVIDDQAITTDFLATLGQTERELLEWIAGNALINKVLRQRDHQEEKRDQGELYETHLQKTYKPKNGERKNLRVARWALTQEERTDIVEELRTTGEGYLEHAAELEAEGEMLRSA